MRRTILPAAIAAISWLFLFVSACNQGDPNGENRKKCYDAYDVCRKACDAAFDKAFEVDSTCRDKCNTGYLKALEKCSTENDPVKKKKCEQDALDTLTNCLNACNESFKKAMQANKECREKCERDLADCLSKH